MKIALVTGFPGQDACYLARELLDEGYSVVGGIKRYSCPNLSNLDYLSLREEPNFKLEVLDVTDFGSIFDVLEAHSPSEVYNLAAQSYVGNSWRLAFSTTSVDALGPMNFLEVIRRYDPKIRFYQASTSEMFGNSNTDGVQTEETAFMPVSPYGVAKLFGYHITRNYRESYGIFAVSGILFNHESPIRGIEFVSRKISSGVARIACTKDKKPINLGNLSAERDWGHAKDYVLAQILMLRQERPQDFIVATGVKHSVSDLVSTAFNAVGIYDHEKYVTIDKQFYRPNELQALHASSDKAKQDLGWSPKTAFKELITEMVEADCKRLQ